MNRKLETRLSRVERSAGFDPDDRFAWFERLSDDDLSRLLYQANTIIAAHPDTPADKAEKARHDAARIAVELNGQVQFEPDIERMIMSNLGIERWA